METFLSAFKGLPLEAAYLDFQGSAEIAGEFLQAVRSAPVSASEAVAADGTGAAPTAPPYVLCWPTAPAPPVLPAWDFGRLFFGMLRTPGMSISEVGACGSEGQANVLQEYAPGSLPAPSSAPSLRPLTPNCLESRRLKGKNKVR